MIEVYIKCMHCMYTLHCVQSTCYIQYIHYVQSVYPCSMYTLKCYVSSIISVLAIFLTNVLYYIGSFYSHHYPSECAVLAIWGSSFFAANWHFILC